MYADVSLAYARKEETRELDAGACQVAVDLTRPVKENRL
jgi:hypothetical protein